MNVDTDALRWFQQVADGVTLTEVSELEAITQSGLSRALARLESEVGVPLLRRSGRTLRMTRAGATFKRHVDKTLHDLDDGLAALSQLTSPSTGVVALAFQPSLGTWLVPELIRGFSAQYPQVRFELRQQYADDPSGPALVRDAADLQLTSVALTSPTVHWRPLLAQRLALAVPAAHALAGRTDVALSDLTGERFIMLRRGSALRALTERLSERVGFTPRIAYEGGDLSTVLGFVAAGLGVAVVPTPQQDSTAANAPVRHLVLSDPGAAREIGLAWPVERRLLPAAEQFRLHVIDELSRR